MLIVTDLDGTISAYPAEFGNLLASLKACGHTVVIATGTEGDPDDETWQARCDYLTGLGCGECWDSLAVIAPPHDKNKAALCADLGADLLIDNNKDNAKAAADICPVLVVWQTRES